MLIPPRCLSTPSCGLNPSEQNPITPRTVEHTLAAVKYFELGRLWDEYGIVGDVIVSHSAVISPSFCAHIRKPFTEYFPRASIYENLSPDILHQLIKGTFKDHLVTWIEEYIYLVNTTQQAKEIMDEIDRRYVVSAFSTSHFNLSSSIAFIPPFTGLRHFPKGRGFKQWTGDDSKALMKVCPFLTIRF